MRTYELLADLPLRIDSYRLEGLGVDVRSGFTRRTTLVHLIGGGHEGVGEDVNYIGEEQLAFQRGGAGLPLIGSWTLREFSEHLEGLQLFAADPAMHAARDYRRWAFESAALDLALRQAGRPLADVLGREPLAVSFVVSTGLGNPPSLGPLLRFRELHAGLHFKLDAGSGWNDAFVLRLAELGGVDVVDLKGAYKGTAVDLDPDPALYRCVAEGLPEAWIEDPNLTGEAGRVLEPHRERITWDAPIHDIADVEALPLQPTVLNSKPSRFGTLARLFDFYDHCAERGIALYGGGQFELGCGRGQIQLLASLFHPDGPNDVAPGGFNAPQLDPGLLPSPLVPRHSRTGFRWQA